MVAPRAAGSPDPFVRRCYADLHVRARMREFCGLATESAAGCRYLCARTDATEATAGWEGARRSPPEALEALLDAGAEITRSLWDRSALLVHLDVDYLNVDRPDEAFTHPAEAFFKLEATHRTVIAELRRLGLHALVTMTGAGYHFTGQVPLAGDVVRRLAGLVPDAPGWREDQARRLPPWLAAGVGELEARAVTGLGLVLEHLAHRVIERAAPHSRIPVVLDGTLVGGGPLGRECVSIDLSQFADPLDARHVRVPFSVYRNPGWHPPRDATPIFSLPRHEPDLAKFLEAGRGLDHARALALEGTTLVPDASDGMSRLIDEYEATPLADFHRRFLERRAAADPAAIGPAPDLATLPPCVAACLLAPNDLLLRPAWIQNLTRLLLARGWSARTVADLVARVYREDHGWGERWSRGDPEVRAEAYVRAFAGMIHAGVDLLVDFNCVSTKEKGMCPGGGCAHDLRQDARRLLGRSPS